MRAKRLLATLTMIAMTWATGAVAQMDSLHIANDLGSVLGAEKGCGYTYDQAAIKAFIDAKVRADDMKFPSLLQTMSQGTAVRMRDMSASEKTAFCAQIGRVAKANKFISN